MDGKPVFTQALFEKVFRDFIVKVSSRREG
jgi:hypothetical protein